MVDGIVVDLVREVLTVGKCCTSMTLDARNAFNLTNSYWIKGTGYAVRIGQHWLMQCVSPRE